MAYEYWIDVPLVCTGCGRTIPGRETSLAAVGLNPFLADDWLRPGDIAPIGRESFASVYDPLQPVEEFDAELRLLLGWVCPESREGQWARVRFWLLRAGTRLEGAETIALTSADIADAHFADDDVIRAIAAGT
jgi:hypothetical protein